MLHCVLERKVDVEFILALFRNPGLRRCFSGIDDDTIMPFLSADSEFFILQFPLL